MVAFSRTQAAARTGKGGTVVAEGVDAIVAEFTREADTVRDRAGEMVVEMAKEAADLMRDLVPVRTGNVRSSITSDPAFIRDGLGVFAEAGPDSVAHKEAFVARFLEYGTSKMAPRPFVMPAADKVLPKLERALKDLSKL